MKINIDKSKLLISQNLFHHSTKLLKNNKKSVFINRIVDNMPITWCYEVADSQKKYCSTGFPIGCSVTDAGQPKDACVISVR